MIYELKSFTRFGALFLFFPLEQGEGGCGLVGVGGGYTAGP